MDIQRIFVFIWNFFNEVKEKTNRERVCTSEGLWIVWISECKAKQQHTWIENDVIIKINHSNFHSFLLIVVELKIWIFFIVQVFTWLKMASKIIKKTLEEANGVPNAEIDFSDKGIVSLEPDMTRIWSMKNVTRLTLSHNKITELPPAVAMMENLEILNLFNNALEVELMSRKFNLYLPVSTHVKSLDNGAELNKYYLTFQITVMICRQST